MVKHMVFEYLYRDASNYKAWGELLLDGDLSEVEIARMTARFEDGEFFIAEQIGVPALCEQLWQECQSASSVELDHVWHEFSAVRPATEADIGRLTRWGSAAALLNAVEKIDSWKQALSRNYLLCAQHRSPGGGH